MSKKLSTPRRKRRSKSVYTKGWETRRAKASTLKGLTVDEARLALEKACKNLPPQKGWNPVTVGEAAQMQAELNQHRSAEVYGGDVLLRLTIIHRDEQLCGFMGDMQAVRHREGPPSHAPMLVTRSQVEAIEDFLSEHGYSRFGKGSGSIMSVSTNPKAA